ncbi:hypothetical protein ACFQS7_28160 [Dankookia sp. GCM10030260]|uniref:hypothetical protein n=1 Tax=Dankookia sp. GCM10030260 TaxID=3273390 RepID=UPI0036161DA6
MRQGSVLLYTVQDRLVFFGGAIRLNCCFDCRRRGSCNVDRFADCGEQLLSQLFDALACSSLDDFRSPERISRLLLCDGSASFSILTRFTLQFDTLFCVVGAVLGLLCATT